MRIEPPRRLVELIERLVAYAKATGRRVTQSTYVKPAPQLPLAVLGLGRRSSACEEADAVAVSARMLARLHPLSKAQAPRLGKALPTTTPQVSARLAQSQAMR